MGEYTRQEKRSWWGKKRSKLNKDCVRELDLMKVGETISIPYDNYLVKRDYGNAVFYRNDRSKFKNGRLFEFDNSPKLLNIDGVFKPVATITRVK